MTADSLYLTPRILGVLIASIGVLGRTVGPLWGGLAAGLLLGTGVTRVLSGLMQGPNLLAPAMIAVIAVSLAMIALAAAYVPARRAAVIDPASTLRLD